MNRTSKARAAGSPHPRRDVIRRGYVDLRRLRRRAGACRRAAATNPLREQGVLTNDVADAAKKVEYRQPQADLAATKAKRPWRSSNASAPNCRLPVDRSGGRWRFRGGGRERRRCHSDRGNELGRPGALVDRPYENFDRQCRTDRTALFAGEKPYMEAVTKSANEGAEAAHEFFLAERRAGITHQRAGAVVVQGDQATARLGPAGFPRRLTYGLLLSAPARLTAPDQVASSSTCPATTSSAITTVARTRCFCRSRRAASRSGCSTSSDE